MTNDISQLNIQATKEPERVDWDNYGKTYQAPPPAAAPDGTPIVYFGVVDAPSVTDPDDGLVWRWERRREDECRSPAAAHGPTGTASGR